VQRTMEIVYDVRGGKVAFVPSRCGLRWLLIDSSRWRIKYMICCYCALPGALVGFLIVIVYLCVCLTVCYLSFSCLISLVTKTFVL
jgi:hypothetical protein